jgi:hypothetical protein
LANASRGFLVGDVVSCAACHKLQPVSDAVCSGCHVQAPTAEHTRQHIDCFDCHAEHNGREFAAATAAKMSCVGCHLGDPHAALIAAAQSGHVDAQKSAPVISQERLAIDSAEVHARHFSIPGRCLGCHAENEAPLAREARKTCGGCHAQSAPSADDCVRCHVQHKRPDQIVAFGRSVTADEAASTARLDLGRFPILLALFVGMCVPLVIAAIVQPKAKSDDDSVVDEKLSSPPVVAASAPTAGAAATADKGRQS